MIESYPLYWPEGWRRTSPARRHNQRQFRSTFGAARDGLLAEIRRLGGAKVILSTNIPLRNDGLPYATANEPADPGGAVYFEYDGKPMCFACDRYVYVRQNIRAIALTIEALRGIQRWGASDMMERAFRGFTAIEQKASRPWREVLEIAVHTVTTDVIDFQYRLLAKQRHPDVGGSAEAFLELQRARDEARRAIGAAE